MFLEYINAIIEKTLIECPYWVHDIIEKVFCKGGDK